MEETLPFEALKYLIAQCNYGGRVTDQNDRRLLNTILEGFFNEEVVKNDQFSFGPSDDYILPRQIGQHEQFLTFIDQLPTYASPQLVGLHQNADITKDINESSMLMESLQICGLEQSIGGGQGKFQDEEVIDIIQNIINEETFPQEYDEEACLKKYPVLYEQSMNTVLTQ